MTKGQILLPLAITVMMASSIAVKVHCDSPPGSSANAGQLQVEIFADRTTIKVKDRLDIQVWIRSDRTDSVSVEVFYAKEKLTLAGQSVQQVRLPQTTPLTFSFVGSSPGKSNIFVRTTGKDAQGSPLVKSQSLQGLEVQDSPYSLKSVVSSSLLGTLVGAFLALLATLIAERRQTRKDRLQRKQWLTASLPAELENARHAVEAKRRTSIEVVAAKLTAEGYYQDLHRLVLKNPALRDLVTEVIAVIASLRQYEVDLGPPNRTTDHARAALATELTRVAGRLRQ